MSAHQKIILLLLFLPLSVFSGSATDSMQRMDADVEQGTPLVAHIVVALCDNEHQEINPVSETLGNGDAPHTNLYWGAMYGVKTFFAKKKTWQQLNTDRPPNPLILERVIFSRKLIRNKKLTTVYVVADAWQGRHIKGAITHFLELASGMHAEAITAQFKTQKIQFSAGGDSHVITYVGHDGLMDFSIPDVVAPNKSSLPNSSIVLACYSDHFFKDKLTKAGSHSLLTTNGLMAPEAYTLDAAFVSWFSGQSPEETHTAAATAYSKYQKAQMWWTRKLFSTTN